MQHVELLPGRALDHPHTRPRLPRARRRPPRRLQPPWLRPSSVARSSSSAPLLLSEKDGGPGAHGSLPPVRSLLAGDRTSARRGPAASPSSLTSSTKSSGSLKEGLSTGCPPPRSGSLPSRTWPRPRPAPAPPACLQRGRGLGRRRVAPGAASASVLVGRARPAAQARARPPPPPRRPPPPARRAALTFPPPATARRPPPRPRLGALLGRPGRRHALRVLHGPPALPPRPVSRRASDSPRPHRAPTSRPCAAGPPTARGRAP